MTTIRPVYSMSYSPLRATAPSQATRPSAGSTAPPRKKRPGGGSPPFHQSPRPIWTRWPDEKLLEVRMCDLGVSLTGTIIERRIRDLETELDRKGITFRAHFWLADDWFTPDGIPGFAVPFYLTHSRLTRLERTQLLEVEGGTKAWCMRILRHEMGHAIDNAYQLRRRRKRQHLFGLSSTPYPDYYTPKPHSKSFVLHLDSWYAQSHPDEDFAETFAVWLDPQSAWRERYADWPALKKLKYMEELMTTIGGRDPSITTRRTVDPLSRFRKTLREHYAAKRSRYGLDQPTFYDQDLQKIFSNAPAHIENAPASKFLNLAGRDIRQLVSRWTGEYQYRIDQVLNEMIKRCDVLELHLTTPPHRAMIDFSVLLTVQTMNYLHGGRHRIAL